MAAAKDGELRHFDAEQAFLKVDIDEEIHIEIPEEFHEFPGAVVSGIYPSYSAVVSLSV